MIRSPFTRTRKVVYLFVIFIIAVGSAGAGKYLVVNDTVMPADVCMAMSGPRYRFDYVIGLYFEGLCDELIIIGGKEGGLISNASRKADLAIQAGVPPSGITIDETNIYSSYAELLKLRSLLELENTRPVVVTIVTSEFHARRTKMTWNWLFDDKYKLTLLSISSEAKIDSWLWWASSESRKKVTLEYFKMVFYFLRYRIPIPVLNDYLSKYDKIND